MPRHRAIPERRQRHYHSPSAQPARVAALPLTGPVEIAYESSPARVGGTAEPGGHRGKPFRGVSQDLGFRQLFGGQVLGQCVSAATQTVEADRHVHSLHGYFLRPGDAALPVVYQVDRVRDGGSFSTRRVTAVQKGKAIFTCSASFQNQEEGFHHQVQMPDVPGPEGLRSETELASLVADSLPVSYTHLTLPTKA